MKTQNFTVKTSQGDLDIEVALSKADSAVVLRIDTPDWEDGSDAPDTGPKLRIWLNDCLIHHGVKLPGAAAVCKKKNKTTLSLGDKNG